MDSFKRFVLVLGAVLVLGGATMAAPVPASAAATDSVGWQWPLIPPHVVRPFLPPGDPYGSGHRGVDLEGTYGQPVLAAAPGWVSYVGKTFGYGIVVITHGEVRTTYQPVNTRIVLGTEVERGEVIGSLGLTGSHCLVECLHWGVLRGDEYLDPLSFLGLGPPRLLPYWDTPMPPWGGRQTAPSRDRTAGDRAGGGTSPGQSSSPEPVVADLGPDEPVAVAKAARAAQAAPNQPAPEPAESREAVQPVEPRPIGEPSEAADSGAPRAKTVGHVITIGLSLGVGIFAAWLTVALVRRRM